MLGPEVGLRMVGHGGWLQVPVWVGSVADTCAVTRPGVQQQSVEPTVENWLSVFPCEFAGAGCFGYQYQVKASSYRGLS